MLHDPQFIEAAKFLAKRMTVEGGDTLSQQIEFGFRLCTSRRPTQEEMKVLLNAYQSELERFQANPDSAEKLLASGKAEIVHDGSLVELAAMTQVARMMINLSEFLTKG